MVKQGIIVVSHPRSGSSEFIRTLAHFAANELTVYKPVGIMAECFHWADGTTFGNFAKVRVLEQDSNKFPCQETVLEPNFNLPKLSPDDNIVWQDPFYQSATKLFTTPDDARDYYLNQYQQRIGYVNNVVVEKYFPIIKSFVGFVNYQGKDNAILDLQRSLVPKLTNIEPIFFYRKNLVDTVLSDLIKWLYIDRPLLDGDIKLDGYSGHNFNDTMPPLLPKPGITISNDISRHYPEIFCETLKNYQMNREFFKNVISYDQVFVDKKFKLNWGNRVYEITGHNNPDREYPMNYQAPKKDYFENSNIVIDAINETITRHDLWDTVDELGIVVK